MPSMIPKKPAPHLMRGVKRFSEKIMLQLEGPDQAADTASTVASWPKIHSRGSGGGAGFLRLF
jgi:hypothetical protein